MNHRFYEGEIFHKRFTPKIHQFTYDYFFIDIDLENLSSLNNSLFKMNRLGVMSFHSNDHFGQEDDFLSNAKALIHSSGWDDYASIRFLTLPRIFNFVFNPISLLLLLDQKGSPKYAIAEVHNYNSGRVLYPMQFEQNNQEWTAECPKSMYVSPFMGYEGTYRFHLHYTQEQFSLHIDLFEGDHHMLIADFKGDALPFTTQTIRSLLCRHTFLSLFVVSRTLWQSLRLRLKGISWNPPRPQDHLKQESI